MPQKLKNPMKTIYNLCENNYMGQNISYAYAFFRCMIACEVDQAISVERKLYTRECFKVTAATTDATQGRKILW